MYFFNENVDRKSINVCVDGKKYYVERGVTKQEKRGTDRWFMVFLPGKNGHISYHKYDKNKFVGVNSTGSEIEYLTEDKSRVGYERCLSWFKQKNKTII